MIGIKDFTMPENCGGCRRYDAEWARCPFRESCRIALNAISNTPTEDVEPVKKEEKMCDVCTDLSNEKKYQEGTYGSLSLAKFGRKTLLIVDFNKCPKYAYCSSKDVPIRMGYEIEYCPNCGKKLNKEEEK